MSWVGYRQQIGFYANHKRCSTLYEPSYGACLNARHTRGEERKKRFDKLGSPGVLPAVRTIEAIVHALQQPEAFFCMHVNGCENCLSFAHFLPHDGHYDAKTYGQHTCMMCGEAHFLCRDCVGLSYRV